MAPTTAGFLTIWPSGRPRPNTSNANYVTGQTVPSQVMATIGSDGNVNVYSSAEADVIFDLVGWMG